MPSFIRQLHGLSDRYRVIAPDQLHFGETGYPADHKYINRIGRVEHVIGFIDVLGLKDVTLVGHSEGAFVAARVAIVRPDLVSRLVLLTASAISPVWGDHRDDPWMKACREHYDYSRPMPSEDEYISTWRKGCHAYAPDLEDAQRAAYRRAAARGQYGMFQTAPQEESDPFLYVQLQQKYIFPLLHLLQAETMIIWSKNDPTVPPERGLMLAKLIENSDFHLLNNAGHAVQTDRSEAVNALIRQWCG
ncbi:MAG: alpha/beta hydrolase [Mesorhizobium sp.]|nr:MAG: alpha/beta hydrolase [Mesorhizobium sp.]RWJ58226.1 MAG: alpha/beta hydrolase [Mesorhizobium sp.]RWJ61400.1 MAG: alpha/beta hydrolase [Mesorhizobium sp.]RWJ91991.1 MAG: alpha/beta hydrolase [Mesorhizobium sp.]TIM56180.1 MAG: alpha/beta hydrolase [Mesorhizobium sp.]